MILTALKCITRCSSTTSSPRSGTGIGSCGRVNDGDVCNNKATREDGKDVSMAYLVDGGSSLKAIHCELASYAHTSPMKNPAPSLVKHDMVQRNCFVWAEQHMVWSTDGKAGPADIPKRRCTKGHLGEAKVKGTGSIGEGEGTGVEPDGGGAACAAEKPRSGSIVGGKGDQSPSKALQAIV
jgi:hypothetical protein